MSDTRNATGFIVPSLRRLRCLTSLSMRNACPAVLSSLSFRITSASGAPLYESEGAPPGANPAWMPMEWSTDSRCVAGRGAAPAGLSDTEFRLQVLAAPRGGCGGSPLPRYFPASPRAPPRGAQVLIDTRVALGELVFLGFDLLAALRKRWR